MGRRKTAARRLLRQACLVAVLALSTGAVGAQDLEPVDLELMLAVDVSQSMNARELEIQRRGYIAALIDDDVVAAIQRGYHGRIALAYMEWAEAEHQRLVVDWTLIADKADAEAFVARITEAVDSNLRLTSISHAIDFATAQFAANRFSAPRQVIDISGDGPSNDGRTITFARDDAIAMGVTINGLPLMTREGVGGIWYLDELDIYYRHCVIGGRDAFVVPVHKWEDFPEAIRRKLLLELSGLPPPPELAAPSPLFQRASTGDPYDCHATDAIWGPKWWYERDGRR